MPAVILLHIEVDRTVHLIGVSAVYKFFNQLLLFYYVAGGTRFDRRGKRIQLLHRGVKTVHVLLHHLHGFKMFLPGLTADPVFTRALLFVLEMPYISYVAHIPNLVSQMHQVPVQHIESYGRTGMTEM